MTVDVLSYGYDENGAAKLDFIHHVNTERADTEDGGDETGTRRLDDYVRFISVQGKRLFLAHFRYGTFLSKISQKRKFKEIVFSWSSILHPSEAICKFHCSGTITVWDWKRKKFLTKFRGHLNRKTFASPIKSLKMNGLTIAIGFLDDFVAILQFDEEEERVI